MMLVRVPGCQGARVPYRRTLPLALWHLGTLILVLAAVPGCAGKRVQPVPVDQTLVVLMPEDDGSASAARVSNPSGTVELDAPLEATRVASSKPPTPPAAMNRDDADREFGPLLAGLPRPADHFNLYFRTDSAELTDDSRALLPDVLRAVAARAAPDVAVIGHTDTTGNAPANFRLGLERAEMVKQLLVRAGLGAAAIEIESHGEADLLVPTGDNTAEPRNRRVEITVR